MHTGQVASPGGRVYVYGPVSLGWIVGMGTLEDSINKSEGGSVQTCVGEGAGSVHVCVGEGARTEPGGRDSGRITHPTFFDAVEE
jgi:hypothetical protein